MSSDSWNASRSHKQICSKMSTESWRASRSHAHSRRGVVKCPADCTFMIVHHFQFTWHIDAWTVRILATLLYRYITDRMDRFLLKRPAPSSPHMSSAPSWSCPSSSPTVKRAKQGSTQTREHGSTLMEECCFVGRVMLQLTTSYLPHYSEIWPHIYRII